MKEKIAALEQLKPDLHMHSIFSDGNYTPEELVQKAKNNGVNLLALTDHDEVEGNKRMSIAAENAGLLFVPGVEISTKFANKEIHVVGLDIDINNEALLKALAETKQNRVKRAEAMAEKLEELGFAGALKGAQEFVTNPSLISRVHFAKWLQATGAVSSFEQAFDKYIGSGRVAFVPLDSPTVGDAVKLILGASGVPVLAHPGRYGFKDWKLQALLDEFKNAGGKVIEVTTGSHSEKNNIEFADIARQQGFVASTGSDFHREGTRCPIGEQGQLPSDLTPVWTLFKDN